MKARFRALLLLFGTTIFVMLVVGCNDRIAAIHRPVPFAHG